MPCSPRTSGQHGTSPAAPAPCVRDARRSVRPGMGRALRHLCRCPLTRHARGPRRSGPSQQPAAKPARGVPSTRRRRGATNALLRTGASSRPTALAAIQSAPLVVDDPHSSRDAAMPPHRRLRRPAPATPSRAPHGNDPSRRINASLRRSRQRLPRSCEVLFGHTDTPHGRYDNAYTRAVLGWEPIDSLVGYWSRL